MADDRIESVRQALGGHVSAAQAERIAQSAAGRQALPADRASGAVGGTRPAGVADIVEISDLARNLDGKAGDLFSRLSDETRGAIVAAIKSGQLTAGDAADALSFHQKAAERAHVGEGQTAARTSPLAIPGMQADNDSFKRMLVERVQAGRDEINARLQQGSTAYSLEELAAAAKLRDTAIGSALEKERGLD